LLAAQKSFGDSQTSQAFDKSPGIDKVVLMRWKAALQRDDVRQIDHPLYAWIGAAAGTQPTFQSLEALRDELAAETLRANDTNASLPVLTNFGDYSDWFVTGHAFNQRPTGTWQWDSLSDKVNCVQADLAHSGLLAGRLQGVLRSPTFTLTHKNIYYHIAGKDAKVRLIVDGYFMHEFSALLFRGFSFDVQTGGKFVWQRQAEDVQRYLGHRAYIEIIDPGDGFVAVNEIRLSDGEAPRVVPSRLAQQVLAAPGADSLEELAQRYGRLCRDALHDWLEKKADSEQIELVRWLLECELVELPAATTAHWNDAQQQRQELAAQLPVPERVLATTEGTGEDEFIFVRGNHRTLGAVVPRAFLKSLDDQPQPIATGSGRLELAQHIADPENPLTARVMVNRVWHHLFGRGIVSSVDNFGVLGERPTHPELLDYLAGRFVRDGWSMKRLIRMIVLSSSYRMASRPDRGSAELDPQNLLIHRMRIRRLQGEAIRDTILAISGRLDRTMFGPSIPVHITSFMQGRGRPKQSGPLDGERRRSIYTEVRRNFLSPMMLAFDAPIPFSTIGRRNISNVPAQALILMNDPFVIEQAKHWAQRVLEQQASREGRIRTMYLAAFAREPNETELGDALAFLHEQAEEYGLLPEEGENDHRVWADLAHVLMNVKEFVFVN